MFKTRLRELREANGYKSQQAFADAFGVAQSTVGNWEAGKREPSYETIARLARFFNVPVGCLLDDTTEDKYSAMFRHGLFRALAVKEPPTPGENTQYYDYRELEANIESSYPLSLAEACRAAEKVGDTVSNLLLTDPVEPFEENEKTLGTDESEPRDSQEMEIIGLVKKMDPGQKSFLLALLNAVLSRNQETPASAQASIGETVLKSERQDFSK